MCPLEMFVESEIQRLFRYLLRARGYDMQKLHDEAAPQMPVMDALWICEQINQELQRRNALILKLVDDCARVNPIPPMIVIDQREKKT